MDPIPFLDLAAQQRRIAGPLRARLDRVLAHCQFVLGPEVAELEAAGEQVVVAHGLDPYFGGVSALSTRGAGSDPRRSGHTWLL